MCACSATNLSSPAAMSSIPVSKPAPVSVLDDLDAHRVFVDNWIQCENGSFGAVFSGRWQDDSGIDRDVVVKVSLQKKEEKTSDQHAINETLRFNATRVVFGSVLTLTRNNL
jgi:hypothetical protein